MIGTIDVCLNAHNPNFPLEPVFTFVNSSQSFRVRNVPKKIGKWNITNVTVNVSYPDNTIVSKECVLTGGVWVATVNGCSTSGTCENGFVVTASGIDENEQVVSNYVLGAGNLFVKELDGTITPGTTAVKMYFYETVPNNPNEGDTTFQNGVLKVYDGTNWKPCYDIDITQYYTKTEVDNKLQVKRDLTDMTVTLGTTYDSWYLSKLYSDNIYPDIELKWSSFVMDGHEKTAWLATTNRYGDYYCLNSELNAFYWLTKEQDESYTSTWVEFIELSSDELSIASIYGEPNSITCTRQSKDPIPVTTSLATVNDLPTKTSELTNDSGFITHGDYIEDANGSKINANKDIIENVLTNPWTVFDGATTYVLNYNSTSDCWEYVVEGSYKTEIRYYSQQGSWSVYLYMWDSESGEWIIGGGSSVSGTLYDETLDFSDILLRATRTVHQNGKLATVGGVETFVNGQGFLKVIPNTYKTYNDTVTALPSSGFAKTTDIKNSTITLTQGGVTKGSFTLNQSNNQTIALDAGGGGGSGYTVTVEAHQKEGQGSAGSCYVGGFTVSKVDVKNNSLTVNGVEIQSSVVFHNQEMIVVPTNAGSVYVNDVARSNWIGILDSNTTVKLYHLYCFLEGTLLTLDNGVQKAIEDVSYNDNLLVWDFDNGNFASSRPIWMNKPDIVFYYFETELSSGKLVRTTGQHGHRFFSLDTNSWIYADEINGHRVYTENGVETVVSSIRKVNPKGTRFYNLITDKHINVFANRVLAGCSLENGLYPVENMKFVKDGRALRTYDEFKDEVPEWWFNGCRYADSTLEHDYLVKYFKDRRPSTKQIDH